MVAVLVAAVLLAPSGSLAMAATVAQAKTCETSGGRYDVSPRPGPSTGADPAEVAAANCTLGFREDTAYPLSVIALCVLATVGTLLLVRRNASYDPIGGEA
jgi:hypothetical protein